MTPKTHPYEITAYVDWRATPRVVEQIVTVPAYPVGALVVHRSVLGDRGRWRVTHAPSSITIILADDHASAMASARALDASSDWQFSESDCDTLIKEVANNKAYRERVKAICTEALRGSARLV
jgi:hypothetical protein